MYAHIFVFQVWLGRALPKMLDEIKLAQYGTALKKLGFEYSMDLTGLTPERLCHLLAKSEPPLLPGHAIRLLNNVSPTAPSPAQDSALKPAQDNPLNPSPPITPGDTSAPAKAKAYAPPSWEYVYAEVQGLRMAGHRGSRQGCQRYWCQGVLENLHQAVLGQRVAPLVQVGVGTGRRGYTCCCCLYLLVVRCRI